MAKLETQSGFDGKHFEDSWISQTADGLFIRYPPGGAHELLDCLLPYPETVGRKWNHAPSKSWSEIAALEDVSVPAGEFHAVARVEYQSRTAKGTRWFAPGIGLIKEISESDGMRYSQVMMKFERGTDPLAPTPFPINPDVGKP